MGTVLSQSEFQTPIINAKHDCQAELMEMLENTISRRLPTIAHTLQVSEHGDPIKHRSQAKRQNLTEMQ